MVFGGDVDQTEDHSGELIEREGEFWFEMEGLLNSNLRGGAGTRERVFEGVSFDQVYWWGEAGFRPNAWLFLETEVSGGDWIDFGQVREADRFEFEFEMALNIGRRLVADFNYSYQTLDVDGGELFNASVPELRLLYHHNQHILFRAQLFYTRIERNQDLYASEVDERSEDLFSQLLFGYKLNAQTVAYLGYSDNSEGYLGEEQNVDLTRRDRTFFVKFGYAWLR